MVVPYRFRGEPYGERWTRVKRRVAPWADGGLAFATRMTPSCAVHSPVVSAESLKHRLGSPGLVVLDARAGAEGRARYLAAHVPGALFVSGDTDLAASHGDPREGGRHPLPSASVFEATLGGLGIEPTSDVVVYDDKNGVNPASRAWWMLRALGHEKVAVLDGGLAAAQKAGIWMALGGVTPHPVEPYPSSGWRSPTLDLEAVAAAIVAGSRLVVDARDGARHRGESEPFDPVAGHIPGTTSAPQSELLGPDGRLLPPDVLRARFDALLAGRSPAEVVTYCGSGVTACHLLLGMEYAGLTGAALYVGSFSEWCRSGRPIATGAS